MKVYLISQWLTYLEERKTRNRRGIVRQADEQRKQDVEGALQARLEGLDSQTQRQRNNRDNNN